MTRTVYVAWRDPQRRNWHPIGRLSSNGRRYLFVYTQGALEASTSGGFSPLAAFPNLRGVYQSERLFPLFTNRLMPSSRADYPDLLRWLDMEEAEATPLAVLARSGGTRATDALEVFAKPERSAEGAYETRFFLHGLSHMPPAAIERANSMIAGEPLLLAWDFQNPMDGKALALRTAERWPGDVHLVGYCPRFLCGDVVKLMMNGSNPPSVRVARVNPSPAPAQFRVMCQLRMKWTEGFEAFCDAEYEPVVSWESRGGTRVA